MHPKLLSRAVPAALILATVSLVLLLPHAPAAAQAQLQAAADTARYTAMPGGVPRGERLVWREEPTVIRNNRFLNNWHSVAIYGNTVHLLDNDIAVPEPEEVQLLGFPMEGVHLVRPLDLHESVEGVARTCENNVIAGNRIDGVTEGIMVTANEAGIVCRNNVIRDNTIAIAAPVLPRCPASSPYTT